jgi:hypothetical protein
MYAITDPQPLLAALGEQLEAIGQRSELVVIGGSILLETARESTGCPT